MKKLIIIIAVLLLAGIGTVSANLVTNGGFEFPEVTNGSGWQLFPSGTPGLDWNVQWVGSIVSFDGLTRPGIAQAELQEEQVLGFDAAEGDQYAELDTDWDGPQGVNGNPPVTGEPANVTMSQTFSTISGHTYNVSYQQRCRSEDVGHPDCPLLLGWTGDASFLTTASVGSWTPHVYFLTGHGSSTTLSFTGALDANSIGPLIDDVIVEDITPVPTPEFPSMALPAAFIVGLIGAVLFIQKSKEQ